MHVSSSAIRDIVRIMPSTHEIGGSVSATGKVSWNRGSTCWSETGQRVRGCQVKLILHKNGKLMFHTHPKANRPSSHDLSIAQKTHMLVTPVGVWLYRTPPPSDFVKAKLRFIGHYFQKDTQAGFVKSFLQEITNLGVDISYCPLETALLSGCKL